MSGKRRSLSRFNGAWTELMCQAFDERQPRKARDAKPKLSYYISSVKKPGGSHIPNFIVLLLFNGNTYKEKKKYRIIKM